LYNSWAALYHSRIGNKSMDNDYSQRELTQIKEIAQGARNIFELILEDSMRTRETQGSCLYASILLSNCINKFTKASSKICGGGPPINGGFWDASGVCRGHYWVQGITSEGLAFVADITADQFGLEKIVVLTLDQAKNCYQPGDALEIARQVKETLAEIGEEFKDIDGLN